MIENREWGVVISPETPINTLSELKNKPKE